MVRVMVIRFTHNASHPVRLDVCYYICIIKVCIVYLNGLTHVHKTNAGCSSSGTYIFSRHNFHEEQTTKSGLDVLETKAKGRPAPGIQ